MPRLVRKQGVSHEIFQKKQFLNDKLFLFSRFRCGSRESISGEHAGELVRKRLCARSRGLFGLPERECKHARSQEPRDPCELDHVQLLRPVEPDPGDPPG